MFKDSILQIFIMGTVCGAVLYSLFGGHLKVLLEYMTAFIIFIIFLVLFLVVLAYKSKIHNQLKREVRLEELLVFLREKEIARDYVINVLIGFILLIIPLVNSIIYIEDIIQAVMLTIFYFFWHRLIYTKKQSAVDAISLNRRDLIMDQIVISLLPVFILMIAIAIDSIDIIDFIQALSVLLVAFIWHKIIFLNRVQ